ncbi:hypothetical protein RI367_005210 [Sorochytrium milnesiophthora]
MSLASRLRSAVARRDIFAGWEVYHKLSQREVQARDTVTPALHRDALHLIKSSFEPTRDQIHPTPPYVIAKRVQYVADTMERFDVPLRSMEYHALIDSYSRLPDLPNMERTFQRYLAHIRCGGDKGRKDGHLHLLVCNSMMMGYVNARSPDKALTWLDAMPSKYAATPNLFTYNALLKLYTRLDDLPTVERIYKLILAVSQHPCQVDYTVVAKHLLGKNSHNLLDFVLHQTLALGRKDPAAALYDVVPVADKQQQPTATAAATQPAAKSKQFERTTEHLVKLQLHYSTPEMMLPDRHSYVHLIRAQARHHNVLNCFAATSAFLAQAARLGALPPTSDAAAGAVDLLSTDTRRAVFNALLYALGKNQLYDVMDRLFDEMRHKKLGFAIDNTTWTLMLQGYYRRGDMAKAHELEAAMRSNTITRARAPDRQYRNVETEQLTPRKRQRQAKSEQQPVTVSLPGPEPQPEKVAAESVWERLKRTLQEAMYGAEYKNDPKAFKNLHRSFRHNAYSDFKRVLDDPLPESEYAVPFNSADSSATTAPQLSLTSSSKSSDGKPVALPPPDAPYMSHLSYQAVRSVAVATGRSVRLVKQFPADIRDSLLRKLAFRKVWRRTALSDRYDWVGHTRRIKDNEQKDR